MTVAYFLRNDLFTELLKEFNALFEMKSIFLSARVRPRMLSPRGRNGNRPEVIDMFLLDNRWRLFCINCMYFMLIWQVLQIVV